MYRLKRNLSYNYIENFITLTSLKHRLSKNGQAGFVTNDLRQDRIRLRIKLKSRNYSICGAVSVQFPRDSKYTGK